MGEYVQCRYWELVIKKRLKFRENAIKSGRFYRPVERDWTGACWNPWTAWAVYKNPWRNHHHRRWSTGIPKPIPAVHKGKNIPQIKNFIDSYVESVEVFREHIEVTLRVAFSHVQGENESNEAYHFSVQISRRQLKQAGSNLKSTKN